MFLFQELPPTRLDLRFSVVKIPVRVHPTFWLLALVFGVAGELWRLPIWIMVVFVSILVHELGHALAFRRYGQPSHIVLHMMGGLTVPEPVYWGRGYTSVGLNANQQIFISLAGPVAGFLFASLIIVIVLVAGGRIGFSWLLGLIPLPSEAALPFGGFLLAAALSMLIGANIFWGLINLVPVSPLDGGSVARNILIQVDPFDGVRKSLWLSAISGGILALIGLILWKSVWIALLFGLLAFQSYQSLRGRF